MLELILLYLLVRGAAEAWKETKAAWGKSRQAYTASAARRYPGMSPGRRAASAARHDLGYGLSQLLHGFPAARHGFAQGWHEGRRAHVQARTAREQARTGHAEAYAGALGEWEDLRRRRREALEEIRRSRHGEPPEGSSLEVDERTDAAPVTYCGYCGTPGGTQCPPRCATWTRDNPYPGREGGPAYSYGPESATAGWPAATAEQAHYQAQRMAGGDPWVVTEYPPAGGPGRTVATYRNGELVIGPEQAVPGEGSPSTEGTTSMSDVTYDGVVRDMAAAVSDAETRAAEVNAAMTAAEAQAQEAAAAKAGAATTADQMQALRMDPATLGAMYDYLEALDRAEKAHQHVQEALEAARKEAVRVMEAAQHVSATLAQGHAGLAEAHQNAPVEAADREFYRD